MKKDLLSIEFTAQEKQDVKNHLDALLQIFQSRMIGLTAEERQEYGRINEENKLIVGKAKELIEQRSDLVPSRVDVPEFLKDYEARETINEVLNDLENLTNGLRNVKILLDFDNYNEALKIYRYLKYLHKEGEPNVETWYEQFKQFFPGGRPKKTEE